MAAETLTLDPVDPDSYAWVVLAVITIAMALIFLVINVLKGGIHRYNASHIISEDKRIERRRNALKRFGDAEKRNDDGGDHAVPLHTGRAQSKGMLRHRTTATTGSRTVVTTLRE